MRGRYVAARLRKAKELMNSSGAHWVKGHFKLGKGAEARYCMVGGIEAVTPGVKRDRMYSDRLENDGYVEVVMALAKVIAASRPRAGSSREFHSAIDRAKEEPNEAEVSWALRRAFWRGGRAEIAADRDEAKALLAKQRQERVVIAAETVIIDANDRPTTKWGEVARWLEKAAQAAEAT